MNTTKANAILTSGNVAYICPVSGETVKADDTWRIDLEVAIKDDKGETIHTKMESFRVAESVYAKVKTALKAKDIVIEG